MPESLRKFVSKEWLLIALLVLMAVLAAFLPFKIRYYPSYVDWGTIVALSSLLMISTGIRRSGYLEPSLGESSKGLEPNAVLPCFW